MTTSLVVERSRPVIHLKTQSYIMTLHTDDNYHDGGGNDDDDGDDDDDDDDDDDNDDDNVLIMNENKM